MVDSSDMYLIRSSASVRVMLRTRSISFLRKRQSKPRLLRYVTSSLVGSVKVSSVEQMQRSLRFKLKGVARLESTGCHDECRKY